jgi:hypothetical protein
MQPQTGAHCCCEVTLASSDSRPSVQPFRLFVFIKRNLISAVLLFTSWGLTRNLSMLFNCVNRTAVWINYNTNNGFHYGAPKFCVILWQIFQKVDPLFNSAAKGGGGLVAWANLGLRRPCPLSYTTARCLSRCYRPPALHKIWYRWRPESYLYSRTKQFSLDAATVKTTTKYYQKSNIWGAFI